MTVQEELEIILDSMRKFVENTEMGITKRGYGSLNNGFWCNRDKSDIVSLLALSTVHPNMTLDLHINRTHVTFNGNTFQYDIVTDNDSYFAQSTIDDITLFKLQDFELFRKFYTKITGLCQISKLST